MNECSVYVGLDVHKDTIGNRPPAEAEAAYYRHSEHTTLAS